jgi:TolA-binding protein
MKNGKLKIGALIAALLGVGTLMILQHLEVKRLAAENTDLRAQLGQMASSQESSTQLAEHLKAAVGQSQANQSELARLRGQVSRMRQLEQENTQFKAERQKLDQRMREAQAAATPPPQPPSVAPPTSVPGLPTTDLGMLELPEGIATRFDLGGGTNCLVTPTALSDGNVAIQLKAEVTRADGTAWETATSRITARPGQHCSISVGERMIALAVKLK